jgi:hypothetical protein
VTRWRARTGNQRYHESTDVLPITVTALQGRTAGRADVVIVPPHAGGDVYRVQLRTRRGGTSNVAEARVNVVIRPFWRQARCDAPGPAPFQSVRLGLALTSRSDGPEEGPSRRLT